MARTSANSAARTKARATATANARAKAAAAIAAKAGGGGFPSSTYRLKPVVTRVGVGLRRGFFRHRHKVLVRKRLVLRSLHTKYPHRRRRKGIRL